MSGAVQPKTRTALTFALKWLESPGAVGAFLIPACLLPGSFLSLLVFAVAATRFIITYETT